MKTRKRQREGFHGSEGNPVLLKLYAACLHNAEQLCDDAELLFEARHFPRAYALAFTALEEIAKAHAIADYFTGVLSHSEFTNAFHKHRMKAAYLDRVVTIECLPSAVATVEYDERAVESQVISRMRAFYVDFGVNYAPMTPCDAIDSDMAGRAIERARALLHEIIVNDEYFGHQIGTKGLWK